MSNIPEDSVLKRHYLTELKFKQEKVFEEFSTIASENSYSIPKAKTSIPISHWAVSICIVCVLLFFI